MKAMARIILILFILVSVCGCKTNSIQDGETFVNLDMGLLEDSVLSYLEGKYEEQFEIDMLFREIDGNSGIYYRAVFHSTLRAEKGVLYCLPQGTGTTVTINGTSCVMTDNYANILLQESYACAMQSELGPDIKVKCQFFTPDHTLTEEEYSSGIDHCLENEKLTPYLFVYVFADRNTALNDLRDKAELYMDRLNVYRQYLYVVCQDDVPLAEWESTYLKHYSDFEHYLLNDSEADYIAFSAFEADQGVILRKTIER